MLPEPTASRDDGAAAPQRHCILVFDHHLPWFSAFRAAQPHFQCEARRWTVIAIRPALWPLGSERRAAITRSAAVLARRSGADISLVPFRAAAAGVDKAMVAGPAEKIVILCSPEPGLRQRRLKRLAEQVAASWPDAEVSLLPVVQTRQRPISWFRRFGELDQPNWRSFAGALVLWAAGVALADISDNAVGPSAAMLVLLGSSVASAIAYGGFAGLASALGSFAWLQLTIIAPRYSWSVQDAQIISTLVLFLSVAGISSFLAGRLRRELGINRDRHVLQECLFRLSNGLAAADTAVSLRSVLADELGDMLQAEIRLMVCDKDKLEEAFTEERLEYLPGDLKAARFACDNDDQSGLGTNAAFDSRHFFQPVASKGAPNALIVVLDGDEHLLRDPSFRVFMDTVSDIVSICLERLRTQKEMEDRRLLEEAERFRATILAAVSHDFRTPLASILGSATSLQEFGETYDAETWAELIDTIVTEARQLHEFLNKVLDFARLESGRLSLRRQNVDIVDVVEGALEAVGEVSAGHNVVLSSREPAIFVCGDSTLLEHVVQNLVANACEYSRAGSTVHVGIEREDGFARVVVADQGIGMPPEEARRLFTRADSADSRFGGGLGLRICREVVRLHNGHIHAESEGLGMGCRFSVDIPATYPGAALPDGLLDGEP